MATKKILITEDERPLANALNLKLKNAGFEPKVVNNGDDALKELKNGSYDLLLMDIMMPKRDGWSVLEEIKEQKIKVPVIVMSNLGQAEDIERAKSLGAKEYLVKADTPIVSIVNKVKEYLS